MFCKREIYQIIYDKVSEFKQFFSQYVLPYQINNGAKLLGSWITDKHDEMITIWGYPSYDEYLKIEERVQRDPLYQLAQEQLLIQGKLYVSCKEDFLTPTGQYQSPKQAVTVSGFITNKEDETLLVQTYWRSDTGELPGGGVEEGETLDAALCREILEETGIRVKLSGVTGVYSNGSTVTIVFCGRCIGGELKSSSETRDVCFVKLDASNIHQYIKRGKYLPRILDAIKGISVPFEAFKVRPYKLLKRMEGDSFK